LRQLRTCIAPRKRRRAEPASGAAASSRQAGGVASALQVGLSSSAADLKFLHHLPQSHFRNFKSKAALEYKIR
jgi:hypothetical protein